MLEKIIIYVFLACPEGKYCSFFWCYDCSPNGAGVYNFRRYRIPLISLFAINKN